MHNEITGQLATRLVEELAAGEKEPAEIARAAGLSLERLAQWCCEPDNQRRLVAMLKLNDLRGQMLLGKFRAAAVMQLIGMASKDEGNDLARKACVDILNASLDVFAEETIQTVDSAAQTATPSEAAIRTMLAALSDQEEQEPHFSMSPMAAPLESSEGKLQPGSNNTPIAEGSD